MPLSARSGSPRADDGRPKETKRKENKMLNVKIDEMAALDLLMGRVRVWTDDQKTLELFQKMYESYIDGGCFDGCEFDPMVIVDNDWVNYCTVIDETDENWDKSKNFLKKTVAVMCLARMSATLSLSPLMMTTSQPLF